MMRRVLLWLAAAIGIGCRATTEPGLPTGAVPITPPQPYALWWQLAESCSGVRGEFRSVNWYSVPGHAPLVVGGQQYDGYWFPRSRSIVLTADAVMDGAVVRHEILHALVGSGHSRAQFVERCDGIVACADICAEETGGPFVPSTGALGMAPLKPLLSVAVQPDTPSQSSEGGWVAIIVTATNPLSVPAWAELSPVAADSPFASTFGYIVRCASSCEAGTGDGYDWMKGLRFGFNAGAARRSVFDVHLGPGTYSIWGTFNVDTAGPITVTVTR